MQADPAIGAITNPSFFVNFYPFTNGYVGNSATRLRLNKRTSSVFNGDFY
jgi:hypothetical protein